jgi:DNA-binding NarL/FixJ family response regulator
MRQKKPKRTRVLIVDRYAAVREGLAALLTSEDEFEVVGEAATAAEALKQVGALHPDLVLLDMEMPLGGVQALKDLRAAADTPVVVALSMNGKPALSEDCAQPCDGYIQKGITPEDVLRTIRAALAKQPFPRFAS